MRLLHPTPWTILVASQILQSFMQMTRDPHGFPIRRRQQFSKIYCFRFWFRFRVVVQVQQLEPSQDLFYSRLDLVQNEIWFLLFGFTTNATTAAAGGTSSKVAARVGNGQAALTPSKAITVS
jgi:hypothetical protein